MGQQRIFLGRRGAFRALVWRVFRKRTEPVEVVEQRFNFLPRAFRWRGDVRRVRSVVQIGEQVAHGGRPRRYFQVVCQDDSRVVLYQDLQLGAWYVRV